jgi:hypothetical protein
MMVQYTLVCIEDMVQWVNLAASRIQVEPEWPPVACKNSMRLAASRKQFLCRVAASHKQIVPEWPPVAGKFPAILVMLHATGSHKSTMCMRLAATRVQFTCVWRPLGTIWMRLPASRKHFLHTLAASCVQSRQFFESTLREQLF